MKHVSDHKIPILIRLIIFQISRLILLRVPPTLLLVYQKEGSSKLKQLLWNNFWVEQIKKTKLYLILSDSIN
jgi:hypothetical protein